MLDVSNENDVGVQPFPDALAVARRSRRTSASSPLRSPTGDDLFYMDGGSTLTAAAVQTDASAFRIAKCGAFLRRGSRFGIRVSEHLIMVQGRFTEPKALPEG